MEEASVLENIHQFQLEAEEELRFEVDENSEVILTLMKGKAEIFGTELESGKNYTFPAFSNIAVFTWHGCTVRLSGRTSSAGIASQTPMVIYVNVHASIESMRCKAEETQSKGPCVMITGPTDVGKSTLCRILLNYAVRLGRRPIFVDLDVGQGQISLPGTVSALLLEKPADIEEGFPLHTAMVYHYGYKSPGNNIIFYNKIVSRIADLTAIRAESNHRTHVSGFVINTCGWVKSDGYRAITHAALAFEVDAILVIDHEKLYHQLVRDMPKFVHIALLPKSTGVVERTRAVRIKSRENRISEYFYGFKWQLVPHTFDIKFSDIKLFRVGPPYVPDRLSETELEENGLKLFPVNITPYIQYHILSVSFTDDMKEVIWKHIAGFVCVTEVDMVREVVTVLSPEPGPLPKGILLIGDVQFTDIRQQF